MPGDPPDTPDSSATADRGSVAARDIINSIITTHSGLDEKAVRPLVAEAVTEAQRPVTEQLSAQAAQFAALTAQIAREKGVEAAPLRAVLEKLGEFGVPDAEIPVRLANAADQLIELRTQLARLRNDRPELAVIRQQALELIDRGDLDGARAALNRGREVARRRGHAIGRVLDSR